MTVRYDALEIDEIDNLRGQLSRADYHRERTLGRAGKPSRKHPRRIQISPAMRAKLAFVLELQRIRCSAEKGLEAVMTSGVVVPELALMLAAEFSTLEQSLHDLLVVLHTAKQRGTISAAVEK